MKCFIGFGHQPFIVAGIEERLQFNGFPNARGSFHTNEWELRRCTLQSPARALSRPTGLPILPRSLDWHCAQRLEHSQLRLKPSKSVVTSRRVSIAASLFSIPPSRGSTLSRKAFSTDFSTKSATSSLGVRLTCPVIGPSSERRNW